MSHLDLGVATLARVWGKSSVSPTFWRTWLRQQLQFLGVAKQSSLSPIGQSLASKPRLAALPFEALSLAVFFFAILVRGGVVSVVQNEAGSIRSKPQPFQPLLLARGSGRSMLDQRTNPGTLNDGVNLQTPDALVGVSRRCFRPACGFAQNIRPDTNCRVGCAHQRPTDCGGHSPPYGFWAQRQVDSTEGTAGTRMKRLVPQTTGRGHRTVTTNLRRQPLRPAPRLPS